MPPLTNTRWETFTQNWFEGKTQCEAALIAGYSQKALRSISSRLITKANILARYNELQELSASKKVLTKQQRMEILSEIASGNLIDYQEVGADGGYLSIGKESPNTRAISEITSRTEYDKEGSGAALVTKVRLHNPVPAIDLLNKMDRIYSDAPIVNVDNRVVNFIVKDKEQADKIERLVAGISGRTGRLIGES